MGRAGPVALCVALGTVAGIGAHEPKVLLAVVAAVALVAGVLSPAVGLFLLAALEVTRASLVLEELHGIPSFIVPYSLALLVVGLLRRPPGSTIGPELLVPLALGATYGVVRLLGVLQADEPTTVWAGTQAYAKELIAVAAVIVLVRTGSLLRAAVWGIVIAGLGLAVVNIAQHLIGAYDSTFFGFARPAAGFVVGEHRARIGGPVADPNYFAQTMVVVVAVALERAWHERATVLRVTAAVTAVLSVLTIVYTSSRGGWIALIVVLAVAAWRVRPLPSTVAALAVVLLLVVAVGPARYRESLRSIVDPDVNTGEVDGSLALRGNLLRIGLDMALDHPVLGVGWRQYPEHYLDYAAGLDIETKREERLAHSLPLEVAAESGVVGLVTFGAIPVMALVTAQRARRRLAAAGRGGDGALVGGVQLGLVAFLVTALFLSYSSPQVFWLLIGLAFAARLPSEASPEPTRPRPPSTAAAHG